MSVPQSSGQTADFRTLWKRIAAQKKYGIPVRRMFFCDCGYAGSSYERLFIHTSKCSAPALPKLWGNAFVKMPKRELEVLDYERQALEGDQALSSQIWEIAYQLTGMKICPTETLKPKFFEVAAWYDLPAPQVDNLWNS